MRRPLFTADSASVTVLRSLASSAFGKYDLTIPEGMDPEDFYEFAAPDNELAYVASLVPPRRVGGLARRFVRADVQVTAKDDTDPDWVASSTVDDVLEEAAERTSGDLFLESDISKAGLNGYEPFVDFTVGDKADVDVWGRYVTLPVTRIQPGVSEHDTSDFLVHLGGQIVSDTDARLAENEEIRRALIEDRRDLAGLEARFSGALERERSDRVEALKSEAAARDTAIVEAVSAETVEREKADAALSQTLREGLDAEAAEREKLADDLGELATTSKTLVDDMGKVVTTADFEQYDAALQADLWLRQQAQNELNADFQEQQSALNVLQGDQISTLNAVQTVLAVGRVGFIAIRGGSGGVMVQVEDAFVRKAAGSMSVEAKGAWVGQIAVIYPPADSYGVYGNGIAVFDVTASNRYFNLPGGAGLGALVFYRIAPSAAYAIELRDSSLTVADGRSWVAVPLRKTDGSTVSYFEVVDPGSTLFYGGAFATMSVPFSVTVQVVQTVGSTTSVLWERTNSAIQYTPSNGASFYKASGFFRLDGSNAGSPARFVKGGRVSVRAKVSAAGSASVGMEYGAKFSFIQDNV